MLKDNEKVLEEYGTEIKNSGELDGSSNPGNENVETAK